MPLTFLESMPASFARQSSAFSKFVENFNGLKMNLQHKDSNLEEQVKLALFDNAISPTRVAPSTFVGGMVTQAKVSMQKVHCFIFNNVLSHSGCCLAELFV